MGVFIRVDLDPDIIGRTDGLAAKLVEVCPVKIFAPGPDAKSVAVVEENVDECTLCELCLAVGNPGQVRVLKLYDDARPLERSA